MQYNDDDLPGEFMLREAANQWFADRAAINRERNYGIDRGKYEWCSGSCKEQVANCRCEKIKREDEYTKAWGRFQNALWKSEGVAGARKEIEAMGFSKSQIEASIKQIATWKLQDEAGRNAGWYQNG